MTNGQHPTVASGPEVLHRHRRRVDVGEGLVELADASTANARVPSGMAMKAPKIVFGSCAATVTSAMSPRA